MQVIDIDISKGWQPDFLRFGMPKGGLITCKNLIPFDEYYEMARGKAIYSTNAVAGTPLSAQEFMASDGTRYLIAGTATKLYRLETDRTFTDVTKLSTTYGNTSTRWYFAKYGQWVIATNFVDVPQVLKGFTTANFVDLGGSPPIAKFCILYKNQLIFGYTNESGTITPNRLAWSGRENVESYGSNLATGADSTVLEDVDGKMTGLIHLGNNFGVYHEHSISLGYYEIPLGIKFIQNRVSNIGAIEGSIIPVGNNAFSFDEKDFHFFDGANATAIGLGVKRTILYSVDLTNLHRITTAVDLRNGILFWSFPSTSADPSGTPDTIIAYNWRNPRFTKIEVNHECIFNVYRAVATIDSIDVDYPTIDDCNFPYDSNLWQATTFVACLDTDGKVKLFSGAALGSEIESAEIYSANKDGVPDGNVLAVHRICPKVQKADASSINISIGSRFTPADELSYSSTTTVGSNGYADIRASGKYLTCRMTAGNHNGIYGLYAEGRKAGKR